MAVGWLLALICAPWIDVPAAPRPQESAQQRLQAIGGRLNEVRALTARFTQTLESAALPGPQIEEGTMYLMRPGRMRWEYTRPTGKLAVADGRRTWLYLPEDRQVVTAPLPDAVRDQGLGLLLRSGLDLQAEFDAEWGRPAGAGSNAPLVLKPRRPHAAFERLVVEADASGFPIVLAIVDPLGGSLTYRFSDLRFGGALSDSLFQFTPPPGVEVQEVP